jgi:hypothetical protein
MAQTDAAPTAPRMPVARGEYLVPHLRVLGACALHDIQTALTERVFTIISVLIPLNFLLLFLLFAIIGGAAPIAVVMQGHGPYARQFLRAMQKTDSFLILSPARRRRSSSCAMDVSLPS